jgi:hypothetical protein
MTKLDITSPNPPQIHPARQLTGRIAEVLAAPGPTRGDGRSVARHRLTLDFEGIVGERHRGWTRKADARVPYLKRGTEMRNTRHVSIVSVEELAEIARRLEIATCDPAWFGANLVTEGVPNLSSLPRWTKLIFPSGLILSIEDQNPPCTVTGGAIMRANPGRNDIQFAFTKLATRLRGLVASVEHPGTVEPDTVFSARLPEQWIY